MPSSSLGFHSSSVRSSGVTPTPVALRSSYLDPTFRIVPRCVAFGIFTASVSGVFVVQFLLKNEHSHPHRHDERFLWQSNLLLNIVIVYLSLQSASPLFHTLARFLDSLVVDAGLLCDFLAFFCIAVTCLVPVHMMIAAGDIPTVNAGYFVLLYLLLAAIALSQIALFVRLLHHVQRTVV